MRDKWSVKHPIKLLTLHERVLVPKAMYEGRTVGARALEGQKLDFMKTW